MDLVEKNSGQIKEISVSNSKGLTISLLNYGGIVKSVSFPDRLGNPRQIVLGYGKANEYLNDPFYLGALIGRFANRINYGKFELNGKTYQLSRNLGGKHHIHGGVIGFNKVFWKTDIEMVEGTANINMKYYSEDGEEGYPGNLSVEVIYSVNENNDLSIEYKAKTDRPTPVNLTNHSYWNLSGKKDREIYDHVLKLNCDGYLEVDEDFIPTGKIIHLNGGPMDFREPKAIGRDIGKVSPGYDHCYIRGNGSNELKEIASVYAPESGIEMKVATSMPAVQFYTGNYLKEPFLKHGAFCLETQYFPDSPNRKEFPDCILRPGEVYYHRTVFSFSVLS